MICCIGLVMIIMRTCGVGEGGAGGGGGNCPPPPLLDMLARLISIYEANICLRLYQKMSQSTKTKKVWGHALGTTNKM